MNFGEQSISDRVVHEGDILRERCLMWQDVHQDAAHVQDTPRLKKARSVSAAL